MQEEQAIFDKETLWQINFAELVAPARASDIWTLDKKRVWFQTVLRDFSGEVAVWVREKPALQLASAQDANSFSQAVTDGEVLFPMLSSVRVLRTVEKTLALKSLEKMATPRPLTLSW